MDIIYKFRPHAIAYYVILVTLSENSLIKKTLSKYVLLPIIILYIQYVCNQGKTETKIKDCKNEIVITVITTFIPPLF